MQHGSAQHVSHNKVMASAAIFDANPCGMQHSTTEPAPYMTFSLHVPTNALTR